MDISGNAFRRYRLLQKGYVEARREAAGNRTCDFNALPVFPLWTPFWDVVLFRSKYQTSNWTREDFLKEALEKIRYCLQDQTILCMRGDLHDAATENAKVLLIIKEVPESDRELAIVELVVEPIGKRLAISVSASGWPDTIHIDVPCVERYRHTDLSELNRFFQTSWEGYMNMRRGRYHEVFRPETREAMKTLHKALDNIVQDIVSGEEEEDSYLSSHFDDEGDS